jgi:hypothetical protein
VGTVPVPRTWTTGEVVTAAFMNGVRDALNFILTPPLFVGRQTVAQSIANNAWTAAAWDAEDSDTAGGHSTVTNTSRYTGQYPGWYQLNTSMDWATSAAGTRALAWQTNGNSANRAGKTQYNPGGFDTAQVTGGTVFLNGTTDYVEVMVWQNTGGALSTGSTDGNPRYQLRWISN